MFRAKARTAKDDALGRDLFDAIGRFLADQRLPADPANYAFAHHLLTEPGGPLTLAFEKLTDGGVRLTSADIATLTGALAAAPAANDEQASGTDQLADRTEHQLRDFTDLMARVRAETSGFGRDLAASVDGLARIDGPEIVQLTAAMLNRVRSAETRLEQANSEAMTLREQLEAARGDARSDALTGLPNRRALLEDFAEQAATGASLCLAVCDIDHFKRINDRFGHPVGDRVLRAIGAAIAETCGKAFVTRYGGEEFAVLFSGERLDDAAATLDRARAAVAAKRYKMRQDDTPLGAVTFSAGIVTVTDGEAFEAAFDRADALLYAAKNGGRNQIRH